MDLVPEGSLASGMQLAKDGRRKAGWRFVSPRLDRLWREYKVKQNLRSLELNTKNEI